MRVLMPEHRQNRIARVRRKANIYRNSALVVGAASPARFHILYGYYRVGGIKPLLYQLAANLAVKLTAKLGKAAHKPLVYKAAHGGVVLRHNAKLIVFKHGGIARIVEYPHGVCTAKPLHLGFGLLAAALALTQALNRVEDILGVVQKYSHNLALVNAAARRYIHHAVGFYAVVDILDLFAGKLITKLPPVRHLYCFHNVTL